MTSGWTIGGVTLPYAPNKLSKKKPPVTNIFDTDGADSDVIVSGKGVKTVMLGGIIATPGASNATLISTYLDPLDAMIGTEVAVTSPDGQFDGDWMFDWVWARGADGPFIRYEYTITLTQGGHHYVL